MLSTAGIAVITRAIQPTIYDQSYDADSDLSVKIDIAIISHIPKEKNILLLSSYFMLWPTLSNAFFSTQLQCCCNFLMIFCLGVA